MAENLLKFSNRKWRELGFEVGNTEQIVRIPDRSVPGGFRVTRKDLYGFCDRVLTDGKRLIFLQVTSWNHVSTRAKKILSEETGRGRHKRPIREIAAMLLSIPNVEIIVEGWKLDREKYRWVSRERHITLEEVCGSGS